MPITAPLTPPPVSAAPPPGAGAPESPVLELLLIASRPDRERRHVALAVAGALALHLLLLLVLLVAGPLGGNWLPGLPVASNPDQPTITLLWPGLDVSGAGRAQAPAPAPAAAGEGRLVTPREVPTRIPSIPRPGAGAGGAQPEGAGAGGAGQGAGAGGGGGGPMSAAERLRPHSWDRRLWEPPDALLPSQSDNQRVAARVQGELDLMNDSASAAAAAARTGRDWSWRDKNGKLWGVTPDGKVHVAGITVPLPLLFSPGPGRRDEYEKNAANWDEIQRSASQAEIHHTFDERVKAIRERKDKERQEEKKKKADDTTSK